MSPYEFGPCREAFTAAAAALGWTRHEYTEQHERDDRSSWTVAVWQNATGKRLFSENELSEAMAREVIRLAAERSKLRDLLGRFVASEADPCQLDHHGSCQMHDFFDGPCPVPEARELLGLSPARGGGHSRGA